jgi:hypothetical protein
MTVDPQRSDAAIASLMETAQGAILDATGMC